VAESLYSRLGGYDGIAAVCDNLLPRLQSRPQLGRFWCAQAGGPMTYVGRDMKTSHKGMRIDEKDWTVFIGHLGSTLDAFKVPARERADVLGFIQSLKADVSTS